jgi:hypothetical protein
MLKSVQKWLALRSYAKGLGADLKRRYGKQKHYTAAQVRRTAELRRYNIAYLCYALCIYCTPGEFAEYHRATGEACDYAAMRSEVADRFFDGDAAFNAADVIESAAGWDTADFGGGDGGGFDVGDAGGDSNGGTD